MSEAIFGFIGTIIGGLLALLGTYFSLRHNSKLELRRLSLSFLLQKKIMIEQLIEKYSFTDTGTMEEDYTEYLSAFDIITEFLRLKSHYFSESKEFSQLYSHMDSIIKDKNDIGDINLLGEKVSFYESFNTFISEELNNTMKNINRLIRLK